MKYHSLERWLRRFAAGALLLNSGCAPYFHQPLSTQPARIGAEINASAELRSLPMPREKAVVAVYKFRDQTGQYKPTASGSSFSTAVTQGATTILMRALEESRWFDPIERENLSNLLNERKIIRSTRAEFAEQTGQRQPPLPPLLFAGVILEGGIISYDANVLTGGAGLRYFGAGASGQYRQDRVTVYLRAISTANGRVLKTVYTSKTILSQQVDASLFRFVNFKRLLETETGFTYNEPSEMAVKEAIEKSVRALVFEGIKDGLWNLKNPEDATGEGMTAYLEEKDHNMTLDALGREVIQRRTPFGLGLSGGLQRYSGDFANSRIRPQGALTMRYQWGNGRWSSMLAVGHGQLAADKYFSGSFNFGEAGLLMRVLPYDVFTPYIIGGGGVTRASRIEGLATTRPVMPYALFGIGAEVLVTKRMGLSLSFENRYFLDDKLDNIAFGRYNDYTWGTRLGFTFYMGGKK